MTIKELIEELKKYPEDTEVRIDVFDYHETVVAKTVTFIEGYDNHDGWDVDHVTICNK